MFFSHNKTAPVGLSTAASEQGDYLIVRLLIHLYLVGSVSLTGLLHWFSLQKTLRDE